MNEMNEMNETELRDCPACKGTGKQKIESSMVTVEGEMQMPIIEIDCIWCKGKGKATAEVLKTLDIYNNIWCECGNPSGEVDFFDNGEHPQLNKHHWRCRDCKKVVQIG